MVAIVDYGVGNLFSLRSSFAAIGQQAVATANPDLLAKADRLVLPGVGAFGDAAAALRQSGLDKAVLEAAEAGKPLLGICLGMQLLLEKSFEYGEHKGLGLIPGEVRPIPGTKNPVSSRTRRLLMPSPQRGDATVISGNAPTMHNPTGPLETGSTIYRPSVLTVSVRTVHVLKGMLRPT